MTNTANVPPTYHIAPAFRDEIDRVRNFFFSRDPACWPVFGDPVFAEIMNFRKQKMPLRARVQEYPNGKSLLRYLRQQDRMPSGIKDPKAGVDPILLFAAALSKNWEDPASVENVVTSPSDPALFGSMTGILANPNLVHPEYSEMAGELEAMVVRQMATLAGYDPEQATGIFTQGGTFCNLYGYLLGIRKSLPQSRDLGLEYGQDYRIINSGVGHYSNMTNLSLLGVNIRRKTIRIRATDSNDVDLAYLEQQLTACFQLQCVVPTIMLTMGTTDTFGVDRVKPVCDIRDRLCKQFDVPVKPHIHVDSAIGWPLLFFLDYDFQKNPLRINAATLPGLSRNVDRFRELQLADSFTIDFQKWGYVPYTSSLVMIKNKSDLKALEHDQEYFSYFEKSMEGQTHLHSTIECSRGGAGLFGAHAALQYLGVEGFQRLIANTLQNANYFRFRLTGVPGVKLMAAQNQGPSVGFRMYDPEQVSNPDAEFDFECRVNDAVAYRKRVERNSRYHREIFLRRGKVGLYTNWVEFIAHTDYDAKGHCGAIPGEKAVFMNPRTRYEDIDCFIDAISAPSKRRSNGGTEKKSA
ncbi:MAG: cytochrome ubiquinol oxidase subunit [Pedosphaera sp.]|nr:cytochrome ubiquinol oxidase subunit [Pedosphaera sp.]